MSCVGAPWGVEQGSLGRRAAEEAAQEADPEAPKPLRERCDLLDAQLPVVVPTLLKMLADDNRRDESVGDAGSEVVLREEMDALMRLERIAADLLAFRELYETHLNRDLAVAILDALTLTYSDMALKGQDRMRRVIEEFSSRCIIVTEEVQPAGSQ